MIKINRNNMSKVKEHIAEGMVDKLEIEVPSWGFWRGGTRFETYSSGEEPESIEERIRAAGKVYRLTGKGKKVSLHFPWDGRNDEDVEIIKDLLANENLEAGGINANLFSMREDSPLDSRLRFGSVISPFEEIRQAILDHIKDCIRWMRMLDSETLILWIPDGSNCYGQMSFFDMFDRVLNSLQEIVPELKNNETMLIEYKPFEPAFYATAVFDWGSALKMSEFIGEKAKVLVDFGHHLKAKNVEQIVGYLVKLGKLGGFHLNDRKYADDDLVTGSLNPGNIFRIFCTLQEAEEKEITRIGNISFMLDQSHYIRDPVAASIESIENVLIEYLKSLLVDFSDLAQKREKADVSGAEKIMKTAFRTDVRPALNKWREQKELPVNPLTKASEV